MERRPARVSRNGVADILGKVCEACEERLRREKNEERYELEVVLVMTDLIEGQRGVYEGRRLRRRPLASGAAPGLRADNMMLTTSIRADSPIKYRDPEAIYHIVDPRPAQ